MKEINGFFLNFSSSFFLSFSSSFFVAGNTTYKSPCRSVGLSVGRSVLSHFALFAFLSCLKVEKCRLITAPAQLITAPAQLPVTGVAVYTALFLFFFLPSSFFLFLLPFFFSLVSMVGITVITMISINTMFIIL